MPTADQVILLVTHAAGDHLSLLCRPSAAGPELPHVALAPGEHPAEGAWRALREATGLEEFRAFRKLGPAGGLAGCHVFVTSPDEPVAPDHGFGWQPFQETLAAVAAGGGEPWREALPSLAGEP